MDFTDPQFDHYITTAGIALVAPFVMVTVMQLVRGQLRPYEMVKLIM